MSKRTATAAAPLVASKMPTRTGIVYLAHQLKSMQDTDYVITTNESDFFRWEVGLPASVLPDVLQEDLARWSQITGEPPMILSHIVYPSDYPNSPPFVRIIRPRFQVHDWSRHNWRQHLHGAFDPPGLDPHVTQGSL